jgi:hypothetical protein
VGLAQERDSAQWTQSDISYVLSRFGIKICGMKEEKSTSHKGPG